MKCKKTKGGNRGLKICQKATVLLVLSSFTFSPIFPSKIEVAKAQIPGVGGALMVPVNDVVNNVKETALDGIAYAAAKLVVQEITISTVNWINSGFEGNPGFLENPGQFFKGLSDDVLGSFIESSEFGFICSPFQAQIRLALITKHYGSRISNCSLSDALNNLEGGFDNFVSIDYGVSQRNVPGRIFKWSDWHGVIQPEGNPYGAYAAAETELSLRISTAQGGMQKELDLGRGLLSFRDCSGITNKGPKNINCPIKTPGSVIETQLNKVLGAPLDGLIAADEFNEVISALLGQLLQQVLGGSGLSGSSQSNSNYGGKSYTESLSTDYVSRLNDTKNLSAEGINSVISTLNEYIRIKTQSNARVETSTNLQNQIISRCGINSSQATSANSVITSTLSPINVRVLADISLANSQINELTQIKNDIDSLQSGDTNGFVLLFSRYTELRNQIKPETINLKAKSEMDTTIPEQLNPIDLNAQSTINSCKTP